MRTRAPSLPSLLSLLLVTLAACETPQTGSSETLLPPLEVTAAGPTPILPGTRLTVEGAGFLPPEVAGLTVALRGELDGQPFEVAAAPRRLDDTTLEVDVEGAVADALFAGGGGDFTGQLVVRRVPLGAGTDAEAAIPLDAQVIATLTPRLDAVSPDAWYPGEELTLQGADFAHPSEGVALVEWSGELIIAAPPEIRPVSGLLVPAEPVDPLARDALSLVLTPDVLGVRPGTFEGQIRVVNDVGGGPVPSEWLPLEVELRAPVVDEVTPLAASRGQRVWFHGRGLLPPDGLLEAASLVVLEGKFLPWRGPVLDLTGADALALFPDSHVSNTSLSVVLRVSEGVDGTLSGLGLNPGRFEGTVTPLVLAGPDTVSGKPLPLVFDVLAPRQVVYVKLLPAFDEALEAFGLRTEREAVVARILEVVARDYEGINVAFVLERPTEYVEFAIVEVGGEDPNGTGLFGLDNTAGKDVGNRRFDDVIGGFNAETRARGYAAYGGIFVAEFLRMSPTVSGSSQASVRFDDIFGPFAPVLGGTPAEPGESVPGTARADAIAEAVRVLGNLVGNTISHEVGHSLGLSAIDGQFHNIGDNPGWIMDAGSFRPFEERAEVDGMGPEFFSPFNREYLEQVLPVDPP